VNQLKAPSFREMGKTRHRTASSVVYRRDGCTRPCARQGWSFHRNGPVEPLPLVRQWSLHDEISERVATTSHCSPGRVQRLIGVGFTIHLQGENLVLRFFLGLRTGSGGERPIDLIGRVHGRSSLYKLLHFLILFFEVFDLVFVPLGSFLVHPLHLRPLTLSFDLPLTSSRLPCLRLIPSTNASSHLSSRPHEGRQLFSNGY